MLWRKWSIRWRKPYDALKSFVAAKALVACWESHDEDSWRSTCLQWKRWRKMSWYLSRVEEGVGAVRWESHVTEGVAEEERERPSLRDRILREDERERPLDLQ